jgi:hypothetical protein
MWRRSSASRRGRTRQVVSRDRGIGKAGTKLARQTLVELAWSWLRHQPESALSSWWRQRFAGAGMRGRKIGIVALARRSCKADGDPSCIILATITKGPNEPVCLVWCAQLIRLNSWTDPHSSHAPRCGPSEPKRRRSGKMPSQQHEPNLPSPTLSSSIVAVTKPKPDSVGGLDAVEPSAVGDCPSLVRRAITGLPSSSSQIGLADDHLRARKGGPLGKGSTCWAGHG